MSRDQISFADNLSGLFAIYHIVALGLPGFQLLGRTCVARAKVSCIQLSGKSLAQCLSLTGALFAQYASG